MKSELVGHDALVSFTNACVKDVITDTNDDVDMDCRISWKFDRYLGVGGLRCIRINTRLQSFL
jgi:hypothetical protein